MCSEETKRARFACDWSSTSRRKFLSETIEVWKAYLTVRSIPEIVLGEYITPQFHTLFKSALSC
jgi:hypothetical protein